MQSNAQKRGSVQLRDDGSFELSGDLPPEMRLQMTQRLREIEKARAERVVERGMAAGGRGQDSATAAGIGGAQTMDSAEVTL